MSSQVYAVERLTLTATPTRHAKRRMAQRGLPEYAVEAAIAWGQEWHQSGGYSVHFLGRRAVAGALRQGVDLRSMLGVTVVLSGCGRVVTTYRTPNAPVGQRL